MTRVLAKAAALVLLMLAGLAPAGSPAQAADGPQFPWKAVASGGNHSCGIGGDDHVYCWGATTLGQLGVTTVPAQGSGTPHTAVPVPVGGGLGGVAVTAIAAGTDHTCAITRDRAVWCWGSNDQGQLGDGLPVPPAQGGTPRFSAEPVKVAAPLAGLPASGIAAGGKTSCAIAGAGEVFCWGDNTNGQLGIGGAGKGRSTPRQTGRGTPFAAQQITAVTVGDNHACAIDSAGHGYCWGNNDHGEAGTGVPHRGGEGGQLLLPEPLDPAFTAGGTLRSIAAGTDFTCAVRVPTGGGAGQAWCWGRLMDGRTGDGYTGSNIDASMFAPKALPATPPLAGRDLASVSAGGATGCALDKAGTALCWGSNTVGQAGSGEVGGKPIPPSLVLPGGTYPGSGMTGMDMGPTHACATMPGAGGAVCWGGNSQGQLGVWTPAANVRPLRVADPRSGSSAAPSASPTDSEGGETTPATGGGGSSIWGSLLWFGGGLIVGILGTVLVGSMRKPKKAAQPESRRFG